MRHMRRSWILASALALLVGSSASAQTITFDDLTQINGGAFSSYTESGFTVDLFAGYMCVGQAYGAPVPDLFGGHSCLDGSDSSVLRITRTAGGSFGFIGTDLATQNGVSSYTFAGFLGGSSQFLATDSFNTGFDFFAGPAPGQEIDELRITLRTLGATSYNIDNIRLGDAMYTATPEPSTLLLLGTGLGVLGYIRRRRKA